MARAIRMTKQLRRALEAWGRWYSARLDRIAAGAAEDYAGYEQDLFEAIGCRGVPAPPSGLRQAGRKAKIADAVQTRTDAALLRTYRHAKKRLGVGTTRPRRPTKAEKRDETGRIWDACWERCGGICECGCMQPVLRWNGWTAGIPPNVVAQLDHFFPRREGQSVETCWILRASCHLSKTRNEPDAASWFRKFIIHARMHARTDPTGNYERALRKAQDRLAFVETRSALPAAPRAGRES